MFGDEPLGPFQWSVLGDAKSLISIVICFFGRPIGRPYKPLM
jgi:hypothetical protein